MYALHICSKLISNQLKLELLVTTLRPASPGFATWRIGGFGIFCHFGDFCQFGDFGNFLAIFLAHFDPWTICDNSLQ